MLHHLHIGACRTVIYFSESVFIMFWGVPQYISTHPVFIHRECRAPLSRYRQGYTTVWLDWVELRNRGGLMNDAFKVQEGVLLLSFRSDCWTRQPLHKRNDVVAFTSNRCQSLPFLIKAFKAQHAFYELWRKEKVSISCVITKDKAWCHKPNSPVTSNPLQAKWEESQTGLFHLTLLLRHISDGNERINI